MLIGTGNADIVQSRWNNQGCVTRKGVAVEDMSQRLVGSQGLDLFSPKECLAQRTLRIGVHQEHSSIHLSKASGQMEAG
jgi:hypothetical protein